MNAKSMALQNAANRYPLEDLSRAVADLRHNRQSIFQLGPVVISDDGEFEAANPDHPCASSHRFRRQRAADFFALVAEGDPSLITSEILAELHESLFDRSPAVRLKVAETLGDLARVASVAHLERLLSAEDESDWTRTAAAKALARCKANG